jgi:hypothetical protein
LLHALQTGRIHAPKFPLLKRDYRRKIKILHISTAVVSYQRASELIRIVEAVVIILLQYHQAFIDMAQAF